MQSTSLWKLRTQWPGTQRTSVLSQWKPCWRFFRGFEKGKDKQRFAVTGFLTRFLSLPALQIWKYGGLRVMQGKALYWTHCWMCLVSSCVSCMLLMWKWVVRSTKVPAVHDRRYSRREQNYSNEICLHLLILPISSFLTIKHAGNQIWQYPLCVLQKVKLLSARKYFWHWYLDVQITYC